MLSVLKFGVFLNPPPPSVRTSYLTDPNDQSRKEMMAFQQLMVNSNWTAQKSKYGLGTISHLPSPEMIEFGAGKNLAQTKFFLNNNGQMRT